MSRAKTPQQHRRARNEWLAWSGVALVANIVLGIWVPWLRPFIASPGTWVWCLVGVGYHQGWLHHDRDEVAELREYGRQYFVKDDDQRDQP